MTPYEILGVTPTSTDEEIKMAYRRACMKAHPDRGGDPAEFDKIQRAYQALQRRPCPQCNNAGWIKVREGGFVRRIPCPRCWNKD